MRTVTGTPQFAAKQLGSDVRIALAGQWSVHQGRAMERAVRDLLGAVHDAKDVVFDLAQVEGLDTAGAWLIHSLASRLAEEGRPVEQIGVSDNAKRLLAAVSFTGGLPAPERRRFHPLRVIELLGVIGDLADRYGSGRVRTTIEQKMVILDVPEENTEALVEALAEHDLQVRPSTFRRQTMACTGIEYCKLAIVETKQRAMDLMDELEKRLPDFDQPLTINVNGCPNACARIQVADIGLKGQLVVDENGDQVEGFQIHLGGQLGASFGKKVRGLKTTSAGLTDYVERVVRKFDEQRTEGETFAEWAQRADEADLK